MSLLGNIAAVPSPKEAPESPDDASKACPRDTGLQASSSPASGRAFSPMVRQRLQA